MKVHSKVQSVAILFACVLLAACGSEEAPAPVPQSAAPKPQAPKPPDPTAKMAKAYAGKPTAPVDLKYDVPSKPEPGKTLEIDLAFIVTAVTDSMTVSISSGTEGLEILSGATGAFGALKHDEIVKHAVTVRADRADVLYFTVTATLTTVGIHSSRTFSIPLIFSDPTDVAATTTPPTQAKSDATGQKVESLPAQESSKK